MNRLRVIALVVSGLVVGTVAVAIYGRWRNGVDPRARAKVKQNRKLQVEKYIEATKAEKYRPKLKGGFYPDVVRILERLLDEAPANEVRSECQGISAMDVIPKHSINCPSNACIPTQINPCYAN